MIRRFTHKVAFEIMRRDMAQFLEDHQEELLLAFRQELKDLDDQFHEENLFIDIKMAPLGEMMLTAALKAIQRFLTQDFETPESRGQQNHG